MLIHEAAKFGVVGLAGFIVSLGGADVLHFDAGMASTRPSWSPRSRPPW